MVFKGNERITEANVYPMRQAYMSTAESEKITSNNGRDKPRRIGSYRLLEASSLSGDQKSIVARRQLTEAERQRRQETGDMSDEQFGKTQIIRFTVLESSLFCFCVLLCSF